MSAISSSKPLRVAVLGATGSIGRQSLDILARHDQHFEVCALSARTNWQQLVQPCLRWQPSLVVLNDDASAAALQQQLRQAGLDQTEVRSGRKSLNELVCQSELDIVVAAISGFSGAEPVLQAAQANKTILLANKESVVVAGHLLSKLLANGSANILPVDSEHNAIYQCLADHWRVGMPLPDDVSRLVLTASGGPFLGMASTELDTVTPAQACAHPNWPMGPKISVDSATMANKALELIECSYLFDCPQSSIDILLHPQSTIHAMVVHRDGSLMAQLSDSDMRVAISYAFARALSILRPSNPTTRLDSGATHLDWSGVPRLDLQPLDEQRYSIVACARRALEEGPAALVSFNAINEELVQMFLKGQISFPRIASELQSIMIDCPRQSVSDWQAVCAQDNLARQHCWQKLDILNQKCSSA